SARCSPEDRGRQALRPGNLIQSPNPVTHSIRADLAARKPLNLSGASLRELEEHGQSASLSELRAKTGDTDQREVETQVGQGPLSLSISLRGPNIHDQGQVRLMAGRQRGRSIGQVTEPTLIELLQVGAC